MIYVENPDTDKFISLNKDIIDELFLQANEFCCSKNIDISEDRDEKRELESILVASAVFLRDEKITCIYHAEPDEEEAFLDLVNLILAYRILNDLEIMGLCQQTEDGKYKIT